MSDPFKMEEELGQSVGLEPKSIPNPDYVPSSQGGLRIEFTPEELGQSVGYVDPRSITSPKIHHSTLKKRDKVTVNCRLKRENAEWLRSVAPKGPGGALEIGSVLDGIVDDAKARHKARAKEFGGAS